MTKSIAPPSRYWVVQKDGTTVQRHETVAENIESITYVIPDSCTAVSMPEPALRHETSDRSILSDREASVLRSRSMR